MTAVERKQLIVLLNLYGEPRCEALHHKKGQYHSGSEKCPVITEIELLIQRLLVDEEKLV